MAFLEGVQFRYCNMLDELLVYQSKPPLYKVIKNKTGYVDLKQIQYVSNKLSKKLESFDDFSIAPLENSQIPELENRSEVQLLTLDPKSS